MLALKSELARRFRGVFETKNRKISHFELQIDQRSLESAFDSSIEQESSFSSSRLLRINCVDGQIEAGHLLCLLKIDREVKPFANEFTVADRYMKIADIVTEEQFKQRGVAKLMFAEAERQARKFEASKIVGNVRVKDTQKQPWLIDMYRSFGFQIPDKAEPNGDLVLVKPLV